MIIIFIIIFYFETIYHEIISIIGLMSGTSVDGIDASLIYSDGRKLKRTNFNLTEPYSRKTKIKILKILENPKKNIKNVKIFKRIRK